MGELLGVRFGRLVVIDAVRVLHKSGLKPAWLCLCDCGVKKPVHVADLTAGKVKSCGCLRRENTAAIKRTHNGAHTQEFAIWRGIIDRCYRERCSTFKYYGAKGITMSPAWREDFAAFRRDMGPCPSRQHSIDRIDNAGNYEPTNCRWATRSVQAWNTSRNPKPLYLGIARTYQELSAASGLSRHTLYDRIHSKGWDVARAMSQPVLTPQESMARARSRRHL